MKKKYFANVIAAGVGAAAISANGEIALSGLNETVIFGIQPREVNLSICEPQAFSLSSIHEMIESRNCRDTEDVRSSIDQMLHL